MCYTFSEFKDVVVLQRQSSIICDHIHKICVFTLCVEEFFKQLNCFLVHCVVLVHLQLLNLVNATARLKLYCEAVI